MKYIKLLIIAAFLSTIFTGCSYVSDMVEGAITKRASFTATAVYSGGNVIVSWDKTDSSDKFAGIEIYITPTANEEAANYNLVASRYYPASNPTLANGQTTSFSVTAPASGATPQIYFYRVGFIHWDDDVDRTNYDAQTEIDAISGYAKVIIP